MDAIAESLRHDLRSRDFSEGYAEEFLNTYVATQIKVLREQRHFTQAQLAEALDTSQTVISRIESANYSAWNVSTLKKLARAFNVRLHVSFETYGSLIHDFTQFSREGLERAERDSDPILYGTASQAPLDVLLTEHRIIDDILGENQKASAAGSVSLDTLNGWRDVSEIAKHTTSTIDVTRNLNNAVNVQPYKTQIPDDPGLLFGRSDQPLNIGADSIGGEYARTGTNG